MTALLLAALLSAAPPPAEPADAATWHRLVGLLQYLQGDYAGAVALKDADELAEQRGLSAEAMASVEALGEAGAPYRAQMESIQTRINQAADPEHVGPECGQLAQQILIDQHLQQAPRRKPDLAHAATVWAANCAVCHGATGDAKTPVAATLTPRPFDFHDAEKMATLTPYRAFNTTQFGIKGTSMAAFPQLSEDEKWSLAFLVFTFRLPPCNGQPPEATLQQLAQSTDEQLGPNANCLRQKLPEDKKVAGGPLGPAKAGILAARELYAAGKHEAARAAVVDAYLNGVEPVEPLLRARDPDGVRALEGAFTRTRVAADKKERFVEESDALLAQIEKMDRGDSKNKGDFWSVFFAALLILLREGFEALVVVGALLAVLKKMNAEAQARVVYAAVAAALLAGILALVFAQKLLAGANREWMETVVAFCAVGMLLYAALWLNARSTMSQFMTGLRGQMKDALGNGSSAGLFTVAFTAVARESFETALFVQGLAGDSADGALWGAAAGLGGLAVMVVVIRKVGFVLPMKTLFSASTALLLATSVMVLGKGIHGLQELGILGLEPIPFFELDALGIFPDAITLVPQLVLGTGAVWWWRRSVMLPARPKPPSSLTPEQPA